MADDWITVATAPPSSSASATPASGDDWVPATAPANASPADKGHMDPLGSDSWVKQAAENRERTLREFASPLIEAGRFASHLSLYGVGAPKSVQDAADDEARYNQSRIDAIRGPDAGFNWGQLAVDAVNPLNYAGMGAGRLLGIGEKALPVVAGAVAGMLQPASTDKGKGKSYFGEKAEQAGVGAALGHVGANIIPGIAYLGSKVSKVLQPIVNWLSPTKGPEAVKSAAVQAIMKRIDERAASGGPTAQDMLDLINAHPDKPLSLVDIGGKGMEKLAGKVSRAPGEGQETIPRFLDVRNLDAQGRLLGDLDKGLSSGPAYETADALMQARSAAAKPLFEKAYEGGSVAPLASQFHAAWVDAGKAVSEAEMAVSAAQRRTTQAAAAQSRAGNDVSLSSGANAEMRAAQAEQAEAQRALALASADKQSTLETMRQAQDDIVSNKPGAVWNPRIQQFLKNPRIQQGIKRGLVIERDKALAQGRRMNASEYAIVGTDANGEPIVGKVPTMRLLAVAKEGLDRILQLPELLNEYGKLNKEGIAIDELRSAFLDELDSLNPNYKAARLQWSGDTDSMNALRLGQNFIKQRPEAIRDAVAKMSPNDREFYKMGVVDWARKAIQEAGPSNPAQSIIRSSDWEAIGTEPSKRMDYIRRQLRPAFDSDADFKKFVDSMLVERQMFAARGRITGGSQSAERLATDMEPETEAAVHGVSAGVHAARGAPMAMFDAARRAAASLGLSGDQMVNAEIARIIGAPASQMPDALLGRMTTPPVATSILPTSNFRALMAPGTVSAADQLGVFP